MPRLVAAIASLLVLAACNRSSTVREPLDDVRNARLNKQQRVKAIHEAWAQAQSGQTDRITVREELKTVAWAGTWPLELRMAALQDLAADTTEKGAADTRSMLRLMLPRENDRTVVAFLCNHAASSGWTEATPSLVRSLSRSWPDVPDATRPEYVAIQRLNAGKSVQEVVYDVFLHPPEEGGAFGLLPAERIRSDAWDLLVRVDADGAVRARLLAEAGDQPGPVADMRAAISDLRTAPLSGDELRWLASLRHHQDWWDQTAKAVDSIDTTRAPRLQFRHLEPIRLASTRHPDWLAASRDQLLAELSRRLSTRHPHKRRAGDYESWRPNPERLADWETKLSWPDLLAILTIDDSLRERPVVEALFAQAAMDTEDRTAEYGGILRVTPTGAAAILYPPRPGSRMGDRQFIASTDMISQSDDAIAHYHFHVQEPRNSEFAGPSPNDLAYAARYGRNCLVLTSTADGIMDADLYQPDGVVIDLGEIKR